MAHVLALTSSVFCRIRRKKTAHRLAAGTAFALIVTPLVAETIEDSMTWTLRGSYQLKAEDYKTKVAYADVIGGYESFLPTASYNVNRILTSKIDYVPSPATIFNVRTGINTIQNREPNQYALGLSLPLFDGFQRYNDLRAAQKNYRASLNLRNDQAQHVLLDAATAYLSVLRDRIVIKRRREQIAALQEIQRGVALKASVNDATIGDEALAQSRVEAALGALEQAQANLDADQVEIHRLSGAEVTSGAQTPHAGAIVPSSFDSLISEVRAINPKILAARLSADAARHTARSAYAAFLPQANLVLLHAEQGAYSPTYFKTRDTTVFAQFRIPIYTPGEFAGVSRTSALAQQKMYEALDTEQAIVAGARTTFTRYRFLLAQVAQARRRVAQLARAVQSLKKQQAIGMSTVIDVLNTIDERSAAAITLASLEFDRDRAAYTLAGALNKLGPAPEQRVEIADR